MRVRRDRERPEGTSDFVQRDMVQRTWIRQQLLQEFGAWGYEQVETPVIEYVDTFTNGVLRDEEDLLYRMFDPFGRTLALRPEMTTPVARLAATIFAKEPLPLRLCYDAKTYRGQGTNAMDRVEVTQAGVELIGESAPEADAEMIALLVRSIAKLSVKDFGVALGHMGLVRALLAPLEPDFRDAIREALIDKDLVAYERLVEQARPTLSASMAAMLLGLPRLRGGLPVIRQARSLAVNEEAVVACDELLALWDVLEEYGVAQYVHFDLGLYLHHDYYTGVVVEAYAEALGQPIGFGGRYDHLLSRFGRMAPATGFALQVERLSLAVKDTLAAKDIYTVYYDIFTRSNVLNFAAWLRANGHRTVARRMNPQSEEPMQEPAQRSHSMTVLGSPETLRGDAKLREYYTLFLSQK